MRKEIEELVALEDFRTKAEKCENVDSIIALFAENGVVVTKEELEECTSIELSEDDLANVAGGVWHDYINPGYWLGRLLRRKTGVCM